MRRGFWLAVVALCLVSATATVSTRAAPAPKETKLEIDVKVLAGDPLGSREAGTIQCLSQPQMWLTDKQEGTASSGQRVKVNGEEVLVGTTVKITPVTGKDANGKDGSIQLKCFFEYSQVVSCFGDELVLQATQGSCTRGVKAGEIMRFQLGKCSEGQMWVELTVREVEPNK